MQKPNVAVEVYNNNKKCGWGTKKQNSKSLIGFLSANKIDNYNIRGEKENKKWKKKSWRIHRTGQKIRIINGFLKKKKKKKRNTPSTILQ